MVLVVPADVTAERVTTLKREYVDRVDAISAPRFHEYWEQDPCDPGPIEQEWERNMKADSAGAFLGGGEMPQGTQKVATELSLDVEAKKNQRPEQDCQDRRQNPADTAKVIEELVRGGDDQPDRYPDQRKRHQAPNHELKSDMRY